ncbi:hypothetical protein EBZ70_09005 [bacterium]|nr:hypothetical protein [bacterium]
MKTIAFALLAFATSGGLFAQPQLNYLSLNEGLTFTHDPGPPEDPYEQPYRVDWWINSGRTYYVEATDDLLNGPWHCLQNFVPSYFVGDYPQSLRVSFTSPRYFVRVRYVEGRRMALGLDNTADTDHDGVSDYSEMSSGINATHPLETSDADDDGLPDHWESYNHRVSPPAENQDEDPANDVGPLHLAPTDIVEPYSDPVVTAYQRFKRDWVKGLGIEYGGQFFWYDRPSQATPHSYHFTGDQDGALRLTYTDADLSTVATIEIFPRTKVETLNANNSVTISAQARALYTYINDPDPAKRGYSFSATSGYQLITDPETQALSLGAPDGRPVPRDLLRSIDTMLWPEGSARPRGATQPLPLKRAVVSTPGGPVARRIPAPLAITSTPVTEVGRDRFPVVIRDCSTNYLSHYFQDFTPNYHPYPGPRIVDQAAADETVINSVMRTLDAEGLPQGVPNPELYPSAGPSYWNQLMFRSPLTFARWYRDNSAQGYSLPGILAAYPNGFTPPGPPIIYHYGIYSSDAAGFYPHRDDVAEVGKFTTELHCRLEYDDNTRLYLGSNDDCWVFINGKLVNVLDFGGIPDTATYRSSILFSDIRSSLGLDAPSGTCRLDVFHADRSSYWTPSSESAFPAQLRLLSTSKLVPIYCYQAVAESATAGQLNYSFATDPNNGAVLPPVGMTIEPHTGKIIWDFYASPPPPNATYPLSCPVTVKVTDSAGNTDYQSFTLTVLDNPLL